MGKPPDWLNPAVTIVVGALRAAVLASVTAAINRWLNRRPGGADERAVPPRFGAAASG